MRRPHTARRGSWPSLGGDDHGSAERPGRRVRSRQARAHEPARPLAVVPPSAAQLTVERSFGGAPRDTLLVVVATLKDVARLAPVVTAVEAHGAFEQVVVQAVRREDATDARRLITTMGLPEPRHHCAADGRSPSARIAQALHAGDAVLGEERSIAVVTAAGDDATFGFALAAAKRGVPVAHVEAGLRSYAGDGEPGQGNRILIDRLADLLFAHSAEAAANLRAEGVVDGRIQHVGSTLVDSVRRQERAARKRRTWETLGLEPRQYVLASVQRPATFAGARWRKRIVAALAALAARHPVVFPLVPAMQAALGDGVATLQRAGVRCPLQLDYVDLLALQCAAGAVITDSGSVQEETSALGVRCLTLGSRTSRAVTLTHGTNALLGDEPASIASVAPAAWDPTPSAISLWDGRAGTRIADMLVTHYAFRRDAAREA